MRRGRAASGQRGQMLADYENRDAWLDKVIVNIAKAGFFSADRTIQQYNDEVWHLDK